MVGKFLPVTGKNRFFSGKIVFANVNGKKNLFCWFIDIIIKH